MNQTRFPVSLAALLLSAALLVAAGPAYAADEDNGKHRAPTVDAATGKILNEAIEDLNNNKYSEAKAVLGKLHMDRLSPYELSRVEQILATIDYGQQNYEGARKHFQAAIDAGGLNNLEIEQLKFQIAQLYMVQEKWKQGAAALEDWFKTAEKPNSAAYYLLAVAYYQLGDFKRALDPAKRAVEMSEKPKDTWIQLLLAIYLQREDYKNALPLLKTLITIHPDKKAYWIQTSSIYAQQSNYDMSLVYLELAYNAGLLTEDSEYLRLCDLMTLNGMPYRGAEVLEKALKDKKVSGDSKAYEKLANAWIAAREYERGIAPLGHAASLSSDGELYVRLGEVQVQRNDWEGAEDALKHAMDKGHLKNTAKAQLLMGIALYNQKKRSQARPWFQRAAGSRAQRQTAEAYLKAIDAGI